MLPKSLLSIKGRRCNQTPLVHQDMTKKTTIDETRVKCKKGLSFLFTVLPLINISKIWHGQASIMKNKWLRGITLIYKPSFI